MPDEKNKPHCLEVVSPDNCNKNGQSDPAIPKNSLSFLEFLGSVAEFFYSAAGSPSEPVEPYRNLDAQPCSDQSVQQRWVYRSKTQRIEYWPNAPERIGEQSKAMCLTRGKGSKFVMTMSLVNSGSYVMVIERLSVSCL